jgi:hypothetical protein
LELDQFEGKRCERRAKRVGRIRQVYNLRVDCCIAGVELHCRAAGHVRFSEQAADPTFNFLNGRSGLAGGCQADAPHLLPERRAGDAEQLRRLCHPAIRLLQRAFDLPALGRISRFGERTKRTMLAPFFETKVREQVHGPEPALIRERHGALHPVAELAHVAGPRMRERRLLGWARQTTDRPVEGLGEVSDVPAQQRQDVVRARPQRRNGDRKTLIR